MAYKNALAGLDLGGGKAVIWGDPATDKTEALLRAYGRFVESLGGRYYTACDVGTYSRGHGRRGPGDPVRHRPQRRERRLRRLLGADRVRGVPGHAGRGRAPSGARPTLAGRRVGIAGVGKVGRYLDRAPGRGRRRGGRHRREPGRASRPVRADAPRRWTWSPTPPRWSPPTSTCTRPCALGGALDDDTVAALRAKIVAGGANNQLAHPGVEKLLEDRGILYAPDYVVNAGGVIQVADEIDGFDFDRAKPRAARIFDTTRQILAAGRRPRACRRPWPPTGWPSGGWPRSAGYVTIRI